MQWVRVLAGLMASSLLLSAGLLHAAEPGPLPPDDATLSPQSGPSARLDPLSREDDQPTWFGMGFESRQERLRRDMGLSGGAAGSGSPGANGGPGGGKAVAH